MAALPACGVRGPQTSLIASRVTGVAAVSPVRIDSAIATTLRPSRLRAHTSARPSTLQHGGSTATFVASGTRTRSELDRGVRRDIRLAPRGAVANHDFRSAAVLVEDR